MRSHATFVGVTVAAALALSVGPTLAEPPAPVAAPPAAAERTFTVDGDFLAVPHVQRGGSQKVELLVDGRVVESPAVTLDHAEAKLFKAVDVRPYRGRRLTVRLAAAPPGSTALANMAIVPARGFERTLRVGKRYVQFPIDEAAPMTTLDFLRDGERVIRLPLKIAEGVPKFWVGIDMRNHLDKELVVRGDVLAAGAAGVERIEQGDKLTGWPNLFHETGRPQFHLTYPQGWMGDVTGLTWHEGLWHFFSIHNPARGEDVCWGHAVSKDLVHWEWWPEIFMPPYRMNNGVGMVDYRNHLGLNQPGNPAMLLLVPDRGAGVFKLTSTDRGHTWSRSRTPDPIQRMGDAPRIYWSDEIGEYVLFIKGGGTSGGVAHLRSPDLDRWTRMPDCPFIPERHPEVRWEGDPGEPFDLHVDGDKNRRLTVLYFGLGGYIVGRYDRNKGMTNLAGEPIAVSDLILDYHVGYPMSFSVPDGLGRRVMMQNIGSGVSGGVPGPVDKGASFPCEVTLRSTEEGPRLFYRPVPEISTLHTRTTNREPFAVGAAVVPVENLEGELFHIEAEIDPGDAAAVGFRVFGHDVHYDVAGRHISFPYKPRPAGVELPEGLNRGMQEIPLPLPDGRLRLEVLVDRGSIELYAGGGRLYRAQGGIGVPVKQGCQFHATGGTARVTSLVIHELGSIWK